MARVGTPHTTEAVTSVPAETAADVRRLAAELAVHPSAVLLGAFCVHLRRLTGQADVMMGVPGSQQSDVRTLRLTVDDRAPFAAHVRAVDAAAASPAAAQHRADTERPPFDLELSTVDAKGKGLRLAYHAYPHQPGYVEALLASLVTLLTALATHPRRPVGAVSARPQGCLSLPDPAAALPDPAAALPDPAAALPEPAAALPAGPRDALTRGGLVEWIGARARANPDRVAVRGPGDGGGLSRSMTYAQVDRLRAAVGAAVRGAGVEPGQAVAVLATRSAVLPAVLLGVLGSGARWLLLDPTQPGPRLSRQVAAARARVLVVCPGAAVPLELADLVELPVPFPPPTSGPPAGPGSAVAPPARRGYLMATSGTTGEPALVVSDERPLREFLVWYVDRFAIGPSDATAMLSGISHDALLRDVFAPLVTGGQVRVPHQRLLRDPESLAGWLAAERVTIVHCTPQLARLLGRTRQQLPDVRLVVLAGDRLAGTDLHTLRAFMPNAELVNAYGTTETPQIHAYEVVTASTVDRSAPVPVGHGRPGSQLVVLGAGGTPAGVGEIGEVLIRSRNLASGYLDPECRPDRFGRNPFTADEGDRVYRTGDLGRYEPDGAVTLAGRADDQVKVRGYRVEPGEIEAVLCEHPDIAAAAVVARPDPGGEVGLAGFAVPRRPGVSVAALRELLSQRLPEYARPASLTLLSELPLTPNGKLDRAALPTAPGSSGPARQAVEVAGTPTERLVAGIWREVLGLPRIDIADNFFDIGGHSLSIVAVHARLQARVKQPLRMVDLFRHPTVRALAAHLDGVGRAAGVDRAARRIAARRGRPRVPTSRRHPKEEEPW
jgi:amino acid adenylation domain-containing protein